jgi:hypothetical protein
LSDLFCVLPALADRLAAVSLDPPLHEVFAFIRRRNSRPSPVTRALMARAEQHFASLAGR